MKRGVFAKSFGMLPANTNKSNEHNARTAEALWYANLCANAKIGTQVSMVRDSNAIKRRRLQGALGPHGMLLLELLTNLLRRFLLLRKELLGAMAMP